MRQKKKWHRAKPVGGEMNLDLSKNQITSYKVSHYNITLRPIVAVTIFSLTILKSVVSCVMCDLSSVVCVFDV